MAELLPCWFSQCRCSAIAGTLHHTNILHPSCTPNNSTTTTAIDEAIEALERRGEGEEIGYVAIAKKFGVDESTLRRRHQGKCSTRVEAAQERKNLSTQQEEELVKYIKNLTSKGLPTTRAMIQNFSSVVAKKEVGKSWVLRFLNRHKDTLLPKWSTGMDSNRHKADSYEKYKLYFNLLHSKMQEYKVEAENVYNMNEKGFMIGIFRRSKRVFSKQSWDAKSIRQAIQAGSREWITVLGCCYADGSALDPALIFQDISEIQSSWVREFEAGEHPIFVANSASG
jgi:hypothetical protein